MSQNFLHRMKSKIWSNPGKIAIGAGVSLAIVYCIYHYSSQKKNVKEERKEIPRSSKESELDEEEFRNLKELFENAAKFLSNASVPEIQNLEVENQLHFYGLYKQATVGPCNTSAPSMINVAAHSKWKAWNSVRHLSKEESMQQYIDHLDEIYPKWRDEFQQNKMETKPRKSMFGGPVFSRMSMENEEEEEEEIDIFHWVKEGEWNEVEKLLNGDLKLLNMRDKEGLTILHYACDREQTEIVRLLIDRGVDVNIQDEDGQTPLHYACVVESVPIVELLLGHGADSSIADHEGALPKEQTSSPVICQLLDRHSQFNKEEIMIK